MHKICLLALIAMISGCASVPAVAPLHDSLDNVARDYVIQTLEIGERDPGFVDAYYGPAEYQSAAKAAPQICRPNSSSFA